jgi:hypothetical protein
MIFRYPWDRSRIRARTRFRVNSTSFFLAILAICFVHAGITSKRPRLRVHIVASGVSDRRLDVVAGRFE